jgi:hypothetical protein
MKKRSGKQRIAESVRADAREAYGRLTSKKSALGEDESDILGTAITELVD